MTAFTPDAETPIEWLFINADPASRNLADWLDSALPRCAWNSHVVITGIDPEHLLLDSVVGFLEREQVAIVHLHLVVAAGLGAMESVEPLLAAAARFQAEAYRERTGSRLVPLPILEVEADDDPRPAVQLAGHLRNRMAKPSLLLWRQPDARVAGEAAALGLRIYLGSSTSTGGALEVLTDAHVLDGAMGRLGDGEELLAPCWGHLIVAEGRCYACAETWRRQESAAESPIATAFEWQPNRQLCAGCLTDVLAACGPSLAVNQRRQEGRQLALKTGAALVAPNPDAAAAVTETAVELSTGDQENADSLVQRGLCLLAGGALADADRALVDAIKFGAEPGLVNLHRARVQVAWRDDIEALDRFQEALDLGTDAISHEDLHFEMALSHIRLEEWADARRHLELAGGPSAAVSFNLGVCDVNSGRAETALDHFDRALELGPPVDDLGRVRFFRGFCLKELDRWREAAEDLQLSITLEEAEPAHHNLLGFCLFKLGRYADAVASFESAVALDPTSAVDWANIGVNLERLGETARAAEMYRKALGLDASIDFAQEGLTRVEDR